MVCLSTGTGIVPKQIDINTAGGCKLGGPGPVGMGIVIDSRPTSLNNYIIPSIFTSRIRSRNGVTLRSKFEVSR